MVIVFVDSPNVITAFNTALTVVPIACGIVTFFSATLITAELSVVPSASYAFHSMLSPCFPVSGRTISTVASDPKISLIYVPFSSLAPVASNISAMAFCMGISTSISYSSFTCSAANGTLYMRKLLIRPLKSGSLL